MPDNTLPVLNLPVTRALTTSAETLASSTDTLATESADATFARVLGQQIALLTGADSTQKPAEDASKTERDDALLAVAPADPATVFFAVPAIFAAGAAVAKAEAVPKDLDVAELRGAPRAIAPAVAATDEPVPVQSFNAVADAARVDSSQADATITAPVFGKSEDSAAPAQAALESIAAPEVRLAPANSPLAERTLRTVETRVEPAFARPGWQDAFAERVTWVVQQGHQTADLQLNPPQLGPVEIRVVMSSDQASLSFSSSDALVRDAINAALPRLTEILREQGIALADVSVGAQSFSQHQGQQQAAEREAQGRAPISQAKLVLPFGGLAPLAQLGMVDTFA